MVNTPPQSSPSQGTERCCRARIIWHNARCLAWMQEIRTKILIIYRIRKKAWSICQRPVERKCHPRVGGRRHVNIISFNVNFKSIDNHFVLFTPAFSWTMPFPVANDAINTHSNHYYFRIQILSYYFPVFVCATTTTGTPHTVSGMYVHSRSIVYRWKTTTDPFRLAHFVRTFNNRFAFSRCCNFEAAINFIRLQHTEHDQ